MDIYGGSICIFLTCLGYVGEIVFHGEETVRVVGSGLWECVIVFSCPVGLVSPGSAMVS
jgi:hypothetical protein